MNVDALVVIYLHSVARCIKLTNSLESVVYCLDLSWAVLLIYLVLNIFFILFGEDTV